jgi:hypothetical protein
MNMRSQLDTSMYSKSGRGSGSIGEVLGAVQGVMSIVGKSKERAKEQKELEQNDFLNTTFGNHLAGWDGKDQEDFKARTNSAMTEVLTEDPALYKKTTSFIADAAKSVYDAQDQQKQLEEKELTIAGKRLENEGKTTANETAKITQKKSDIEAMEAELKYDGAVNKLISYRLKQAQEGKIPFGTALLHIQQKTGITPEQLKKLPKTEAEFMANPGVYVDPYLARDVEIEREIEELKLSSEQSGANKAKSDATIAGVNAEYARREKDQGLLKGEADINKKNLAITINDLNDEEQSSLANAIQNGFDPYKINSRNAKIIAHLDRDTGGKVKWNTAAANSIYERAIGTQNTQSILTTIDPLLENLKIKGKELDNTGFPLLNRGVNAAKEATGNPAIVAFNNARDDAIAELERGLLGTGVLSDSKYMRALKNVNSAQSYPQLEAAIGQMKIAISSRLEAVDKQTRRPAGLEPGGAESQRGEQLAPKGIQAGESFTHKNGVVITREK